MRWGGGIGRALAALCLVAMPVVAQAIAPRIPTFVSIDGGAAQAQQTVPAGQSGYALRVPLKPNAENQLVVSASNERGQQAVSLPIKIAQIDLTDIVLARVESRRLSPPEVQELVAQGVINLQDPENFNVSEFIIVLTIDSIPVPIRVPVIQRPEEPFEPGPPISIGCSANPSRGIQVSDRAISIPCGGGGGGNPKVMDSPIEIIPIIASPPGIPGLSIPGVIVIHGKIKTLKEFYRVDLILTNVSTIFSLENIQAMIELPEGKLKAIKPASGPVMIPDLPPGREDRGSFIVRGDEIGIHTVTVHYSATLTGLALPTPIPISGRAATDVEVKGPPKLDVTVTHPDNVVGGEPYDMKICIKNIDAELPALYTSFELNVGVDAALLDPQTGEPLDGPSIIDLGDIFPGQLQCRTYKVMPFKTGPIASCTAGVTQNLTLNVDFAGPGGPRCAVGQLPSRRASPDGKPTVVVIPTHRTVDVTTQPAVTALFDQPMLGETISTGFSGANFRLLTADGSVVPTELQVSEFPGTRSTIAIIRPTSPLLFGTEYTIVINPTIYGENGLALSSGLVARFTTEGEAQLADLEAPLANLIIQTPVDPNAVTKGQMIPITVESSDNILVDRVNLLLDGEFIDSARPMSPVHFMVDSSKLLAGSNHVLQAIAIDSSGNQGSSGRQIRIAGDEIPPQVRLTVPASITKGRTVPVVAAAADNGHVAKVEIFLDGGATPVFRGLTPPYQFGLPSGPLAPGTHTLRAVATDGAGLTAEAEKTVDVVEDTMPPAIVVTSPTAGQVVRKGTILPVTASATDDLGVKEIRIFVDAEATPRAVNRGLNIDTSSLDEGPHSVRFEADDAGGLMAETTVPFSVVVIVPDVTAPGFDASKITITALLGGFVDVIGTAGATEAGVQILFANLDATDEGGTQTAAPDGALAIHAPATTGNRMQLIAVDLTGNQSAPLVLTVPAAPALVQIQATPSPILFGQAGGPADLQQQIVVLGIYDNAQSSPLTSGVAFSSADPQVAGVSPTGLVQPGTNGSTMVTVAVAGVPSVDIPITVAFPTIIGVEVIPDTLNLFDSGGSQSQQLVVRSVLSNGARQAFGGVVLYGSQSELVATVNGAGLVSGRSGGATTIVVAPAGFPSVNVPVAVTGRTLTGIRVDPQATTLIGAGQTQALVVSGLFNDGSTTDLSNLATCVSQTPAVASVAGLVVTSAGDGDGTIECTVVGLPPNTASVHVKSYQSIAVSPNPVTLVGAGKTQQLAVTATFTDASTTPLATGITFGSNNAPVATVSASAGLVTSTGVGTATITATFGTIQGTTTIDVVPRVADGIVVVPSALLMTAAGQTTALTVTAHFNDGSFGPTIDPLGFQTSTPAVAVVSAAGVVMAVANGQATITINSGTFMATVPVNVDIPIANPPPVISRIDRVRAAEGDAFVIDGANFAPLPGGNLVTVGGLAATVIGARKDQLVVLVPIGAASGTAIVTAGVQLTVNAQPSNPSSIDIYQRRVQSVAVTPGINQAAAAGEMIVLPALQPLDVRAGDRILLSSAPDRLAALGLTGATLLAQVDGGAFTPVALGEPAAELTSLFTVGAHTLTLKLTAAGGLVTTGPIHLVAGPDATGPIVSARSVVSLSQSRQIPVTFTNLTDLSGVPVPDGTTVVVSTLGGCNHRDRNNGCVLSDGGDIVGGGISPEFGNVTHTRVFTVTGGRVDVVYDPGATEVEVSNGKLARLTLLPATPAGARIGNRSLAIEDVVLGTIDTAAAPRSQSVTIADGGMNLITVTVDDIRDSTGGLVPDGAVVVVSTLGDCNHRDRANGCISSAGGNIVGGAAGEFGNVSHTRVFTVTNGQITFEYDPSPITVQVATQATAIVQLLPARASGSRIGIRAFEQIPIILTSPFASQTSVSVQPASVLAEGGDRRTTVIVNNITDGNGVPAPNGTKVVVSTLGGCNHRYRDNGCINSAGGVIVGGAVNPDFGDTTHTRVLTVQNGQVQIVYSSQGLSLGTRETGTAVVQVLPATPAGARIGIRTFATAEVTLAGMDQASIAANPTSVTAVGVSQLATVSVTGILDAGGAPVPDGAKVVVSTLGGCNFRDRDNGCLNSAGGAIVGGAVNPDYGNSTHTRVFTVQNGSVVVEYDPASVVVPVGTTATATVSITPARPDGSRIGIKAFTYTTVSLTPPTADAMHVTTAPASVLADGGDNEVTITVTNITNTDGRPVPDGTKVVVSTLGGCNFRDAANGCVSSAGGTIVGGLPSADYGDTSHTRVFAIQAQLLQVTYRPNPVALGSPFTDTARITFTPATPANARIGIRAFVIADVALTSPSSADIAGPGTLTANGTATYTFSNLRDTSDVPLPEGTQVQISVLGGCNYRDREGGCILSAGGTITNGAASPTYGNVGFMRLFSISGGQVSVNLQAPASGTIVLYVLPVRPDGQIIGNRAFALKSIAVTP